MNRQSFWNRRIPTYVGLIVLVVGVVITGFLVRQGVIFQGLASPGNTPTEVAITNVTDTSFTVSYLTTDTVFGSLTVSEQTENATGTVVIDDRDKKTGEPKEYKTHIVTVNNLKPSTAYRFTINSGGQNFTTAENLDSFSITTGAPLESDKKTYQISGKVVNTDGTPTNDGIVYLTADNAQTLSTLTDNDGGYKFSFSNLRSKDFASVISLSDDSTISLSVKSIAGTADATVLLKTSNPVPPITLTKKYDFTADKDSFSVTVASSDSADIVDFPMDSERDETTNAKDVAITHPESEQRFSDQRPMFRGTTAPNTEVEITISGEEERKDNVISDRRGNWSYRPKTALDPGDQTLTIRTQDQFGIVKTLSEDFTILAEGSQFTEPSVAPATPTPTRQATATPTRAQPTSTPTRAPSQAATPTPTRQPTATPTRSATIPPTTAPTGTVTLSPTLTGMASIAPSVSLSISPQPSLPPTGNESGIIYVIIGALTVGIGLLLFFINAGGLPL